MVHYKVKGSGSTIMEIIEEQAEGFIVSIIQNFENCQKTTRDFITKELFDSCLRTGYLTKVENADLLTA